MNAEKEDIIQKMCTVQAKIREYERIIEQNKAKLKHKKRDLLLHYHVLLSEGKDTRKEGLIWIIKAIWSLKKDVIPSYLPRFLDKELIKFLFGYSKDILAYEQIKKDMKMFQYENQKKRRRRSIKTRQTTKIGNFNFTHLFKTGVKIGANTAKKPKINRKIVFL